MMAMMTTCQARTNLVIHSAGIVGSYGAVSLEKFIFDIDTIQRTMHLQKDLDMDDTHLAYDTIKNVGIGGEYITSPHTLEYCRKGILPSGLSRCSPIETGKNRSRPNEAIAQDMKKRLSAYKPPDMSPALKNELISLLEKNGIDLKPEWFDVSRIQAQSQI